MENNLKIENCSNCEKKISSEELIENEGLCINCMKKKEELEILGINSRKTHSNKNQYSENKVASIIKTLALLIGVLGSLSGLFFEDFTVLIIFIVVSIISAIFIYAIGEGLALLQKIADNTSK